MNRVPDPDSSPSESAPLFKDWDSDLPVDYSPIVSVKAPKEKSKTTALVYVVVGLAVLFSAITTFSTFLYWTLQQDPSPQGRLEYVSSYVNLDSAVYTNGPPTLHPIHNFPLLLAQVDRSTPSTSYEDTRRWMSDLGMIYPEDRMVVLAETVSTIVQFRTLDYGLNNCALMIKLPAVIGSSQGLALMFAINLWQLDANSAIDPSALSFATKPKRAGLKSTMNLRAGEQAQLLGFDCPTGSLHTFENTCSTPDCDLKFNQTMKSLDPAIYVTQSTSMYI